MPVTAPADRRFLRGQVKAGRRRAPARSWWGAAWRAAAALMLLAVGFGTAARVASWPALEISRIVVRGNAWLTEEEVLAAVEGLAGSNVLITDLAAWRRRLLESPWIKDAGLRRVLPSTVEIEVRERRPLGLGRIDGRLFLVDEQGTIIDEFGPRYATLDLPVIDGLARDGDGRRALDGQRAGLAARLIQSIGRQPELARRVSQIDVSDPRDAVVILDQDTALLRLGNDRFLERLRSYLEIETALRERVSEIDYVDLRFGERVYVGAARPGRPAAAGSPSPRPGAPPTQ